MPTNQFTLPDSSTISFDLLLGRPSDMAQSLELYERPGLDGVGARLNGRRGAVAELRGVKYSNDAAAAETHITACRACKGKVITIDDEFGVEFEAQLVVEVRSEGDPRKQVQKDGNNRVRTVMVFEVVARE